MKKQFTIILFFAVTAFISAQTVGGSFMIGLPQGDFKTNINHAGYGFQIHGTLWSPSKERPITLGLNGGYLIYGMKTERRPFSLTIPDVWVDVTRTNSIANLQLLVQINPFGGTVQPYVEALFGGAYLFTTTEIKSNYLSQHIASTTNYDDFTWSYGGGCGLLIQLTKELGEVSTLYLDLKARYMYGTEAEYLTENGVVINPANSQVSYFPKKSKTDLFSIHVGVVAYFF
jgi:hypothetical protein